MKDKPKSWNTCSECGDRFFPHCNKSNWKAITVMINQTCPDCGKEGVELIPISDWENKIN